MRRMAQLRGQQAGISNLNLQPTPSLSSRTTCTHVSQTSLLPNPTHILDPQTYIPDLGPHPPGSCTHPGEFLKPDTREPFSELTLPVTPDIQLPHIFGISTPFHAATCSSGAHDLCIIPTRMALCLHSSGTYDSASPTTSTDISNISASISA